MKRKLFIIIAILSLTCLVLSSCSALENFLSFDNNSSLSDKNGQGNTVSDNDNIDSNEPSNNGNTSNKDENPPIDSGNTDNIGDSTDNGDNTPPRDDENDVENIIYPVIFVDELCDSDEIQVVRHGECAILPSAPTKEGYTFIGWYNGSVEWSFESAVTEELTLTAVWAADISYELEGGENAEANPTRILSTDTLPIGLLAPKKDGFSFTGWYTDGQFENAISSISSFKAYTLYAKSFLQ